MNNRAAISLTMAWMAIASSVALAETSLNVGGKLGVATDWTNGIPTPSNPGTVSVDGIFDSTLGTSAWGRDTQVAHTAGNLVGTGTNGFNPTRGVTWNMSGGSITGRFVTANASTFNMSGGSITIRNDTGTRAIQAANAGVWNISGTFTINAAFASTDPFIQANTGPGTGSTYNFLTGWTGSWTHGTMSGDLWRTYVTTHPEFKLDGVSITPAIFDANFVLTNGGQTLSMLTSGPGGPTLLPAGFVDSRGGGNVAVGSLVSYTVTFSKDMNATTVEASEFSNAGTSAISIQSINETSPGVFKVDVLPADVGSLRLQVIAGASMEDESGNFLDTASAIADDTMLTVIPSQGPITVYLLGGQSNMTGSAYLEDLPTNLYSIPELLLYVGAAPNIKTNLDDTLIPLQLHSFGSLGDTMDPSIGFGERMRELSPCEKIALIKFSYNGSNLNTDWNPGANSSDTANWGVRFASFVATVNAGLASLEAAGWEPHIKGMLWHQGEADSVDLSSANAYGANLSHFIGRIREQFATRADPAGIRFVAGQPSATSPYTYRDTVRQAILDADEDSGAPLSVANTGIVATNVIDFPNRTDNVHLNWVGALAMGRAMAYQMLGLEAKTYANWSLDHELVGGIDDDDDSDGLSNRLEFALGGIPTDSSDRPLPVMDVVELEGMQYPVWAVQRDLAAAHVVMKGFYSNDLLDWESNPPELHSCVRGANGLAVFTFRSPFPLGSGMGSKGFFRVEVE